MSAYLNHLKKLFPKQANRTNNYHLWLIILTIFILAFIYYVIEKDHFAVYNLFPWIRYIIIFEFSHNINGSFFYIPFLYSAFVFWRRGPMVIMLIVWILSIVLILPHVISYSGDYTHIIYNIVYLSIPLLLIAFISLELKWRESQRNVLEEKEMERQTYIAQIIKAQEDERKRISQELHDDTIQTLLVVVNAIQSVVIDGNNQISPQIKDRLDSVKDTILRVTEDMRRLSLDLRPIILDNLGLLSALRWLIDRFTEETHIASKFLVMGKERKLSSDIDAFIFRLIQEALNNARRHSKATIIEVNIEFSPEVIQLTIQDNGKGFHIPENFGNFASEGKLGLVGMQERAKLTNSIFHIHSFPGKGTKVSIVVNA